MYIACHHDDDPFEPTIQNFTVGYESYFDSNDPQHYDPLDDEEDYYYEEDDDYDYGDEDYYYEEEIDDGFYEDYDYEEEDF